MAWANAIANWRGRKPHPVSDQAAVFRKSSYTEEAGNGPFKYIGRLHTYRTYTRAGMHGPVQ